MGQRTKVYGSLGLLLAIGAGVYVWKAKPGWIPGVASAKAATPGPGGNNKDGKKESDAIPVELATAKRGQISAYVTATANLRALREVTVTSQAEGVVQKLLVEEGDFVKEGDVLVQLEEIQHRIRLDLATEKLAQAKLQMEKAGIRRDKAVAQVGHTQTELTRYEKAHKEGLVSEKEVATYRYRLEELVHDQKASASESRELQHRVQELEAEIAQSKLEIARTQIRAPFSGFVTQRLVNAGQRIRAMDTLYNIGTFSPLYADVHLSERDVKLVKPGQAATVKLGSDESAAVQARVERLSPVVDQASGTVKVTLAMEPKPGFRPGAFVRVDIRTDTKGEAILIPKRAIIEEDGQNYIFVATGDSAKRTKVDLGYSSEGMIEIRNGVQPGQKVVVAGQGALKESSKIKVVAQG